MRAKNKALLLLMSFCLFFSTESVSHATTSSPTPRVTQLSTGSGFSVVLRDDGYIWTWGTNNGGQLGIGNTTFEELPVRINNLTGVVSIAATANSIIAARSNGEVYTWGLNNTGQLGLGNTVTPVQTPQRVSALSNIVTVYAGGGSGTGKGATEGQMFAIDNKGDIYAWGTNDKGQLGLGYSGAGVTTPRKIPSLSNVRMISSGSKFTLALDAAGNVWQWGRLSSTIVATSPVKVANLSGVRSVNAGASHSMALTTTGQVYVWGENFNGELGLGQTVQEQLTPTHLTGIPTVASIFAGRGFSHVLTSTGKAYGWGANDDGQMAIGNNSPFIYTPMLLSSVQRMVTLSGGFVTVLATRGDNELWQWAFTGKIDAPNPADFVYAPIRIAPKKPAITLRSMTSDNKSAVFSVDYKTTSKYILKEYAFSAYGPWHTYVDGVEVKRNRTNIFARGIDGMGHISEVALLRVNNLDGLQLLPDYNTIHTNVGVVADVKEKVNQIFLVPSDYEMVQKVW